MYCLSLAISLTKPCTLTSLRLYRKEKRLVSGLNHKCFWAEGKTNSSVILRKSILLPQSARTVIRSEDLPTWSLLGSLPSAQNHVLLSFVDQKWVLSESEEATVRRQKVRSVTPHFQCSRINHCSVIASALIFTVEFENNWPRRVPVVSGLKHKPRPSLTLHLCVRQNPAYPWETNEVKDLKRLETNYIYDSLWLWDFL